MNHVGAAFGYPFRKGSGRVWVIGLAFLLLFPVGLLFVLGYAVAAVRSSASDPGAGPPAWTSFGSLVRDGAWIAAILLALSLPFIAAGAKLTGLLSPALFRLSPTTDPWLVPVVAGVVAAALVGLPWGILLLVVMPAATARFAASGRPRDLCDLPAALRKVRADFVTWNLVAVAIVTAWAVGFAGIGILGVGIVPGILFAILASAHATAALDG